MNSLPKFARAIVGVALACIIFMGAAVMPSAKADIGGSAERYEQYAEMCVNVPHAEVRLEQSGSQALPSPEAQTQPGDSGSLLWLNDKGSLSWSFEVEREGLYQVEIEYAPLPGQGVPVERTLLVDGKLPFSEARGISLSRRWVRVKDEFVRNNQGDDMRPVLTEQSAPVTARLKSADGLYERPFELHLTPGAHTIALEGMREPVEIISIALCPAEQPVVNQQQGETVQHEIRIQAERAACVSDQTLYPLDDHNNSFTEPFEMGSRRMNYIGGYNWRLYGQWIEWDVNVETAGWYQMMFRARQNYLVGIPVTRGIRIDGRIPAEGLEEVSFAYSNDWGIVRPEDEQGKPIMVYLEPGVHTLRMEMTLGAMAQVIREVRSITSSLTQMYGKVIMVTGTTPDLYRDYLLEKRMPGLKGEMEQAAADLEEQAERIYSISGGRAAEAETLQIMIEQLRSLAADPDTLPSRLDSFRENLSGLSTWLMSVTEQPLDLDYILFAPPDMPVPQANPNFIQSMADGAKSFFLSFTKDYSNIGNAYSEDEAINVWASFGEEQAATLKALIDEVFTPQSGIQVNFNILSESDTLLFSASGGNPPDVVLGLGNTIPIDYGVRGALTDLAGLDGFDETAAQFSDSAMTQVTYEGKVYGLPITETFPIMFYRNDILDSIGVKPPETWDEVYRIIAQLQERNLEMAPPTLDMLVLQAGGQYYDDKRMYCALDSAVGIDAFTRYTDYFTHYGLPQFYDFYNRMRTGEMPIGISDYSMYNTLAVAAPEIKGLWNVAPVPGTRRADGTIDRSASSSITTAVIFSASDRQQEAWEFLKWFLSTDAQVRFGREMEAVLGSGARYTSANRDAVAGLAWPLDVQQVLFEQWDDVVGIPVIPGSYYLSRHLDNAFREVVTLGELPREALTKYVDEINSEIIKKREEFGLPIE